MAGRTWILAEASHLVAERNAQPRLLGAAPIAEANLEPLWCEVKSIDPDDSTLALHNFNKFVTPTPIPSGLKGDATLNIEPAPSNSLSDGLSTCLARLGPVTRGKRSISRLCSRPKEALTSREWRSAGSTQRSFGSGEPARKDCGHPFEICDDYHAPATLFRDGIERTGEVYEFLDWHVASQCALVVRLDRDMSPLTSILSMSGGIDQTRDRAASTIKDANQQMKVACTVRPAAGIVFLVPRSAFAEPLMVQAAVYGDLTLPIYLGEDAGASQEGDAYHGRNGVFRLNKNRHVSAAIFYQAPDRATFFQNPRAHRPIEDTSPVFRGATRARVNFA